jgi:hypothetical protein
VLPHALGQSVAVWQHGFAPGLRPPRRPTPDSEAVVAVATDIAAGDNARRFHGRRPANRWSSSPENATTAQACLFRAFHAHVAMGVSPRVPARPHGFASRAASPRRSAPEGEARADATTDITAGDSAQRSRGTGPAGRWSSPRLTHRIRASSPSSFPRPCRHVRITERLGLAAWACACTAVASGLRTRCRSLRGCRHRRYRRMTTRDVLGRW